MADNTPIDAVVTSLSVIENMAAAGGPVGVSELAKRVGANKPRIYRHLRTLVDMKYVSQDPETDKYSLTLRLFHIGQLIAAQTEFLSEARYVMRSLRDEVGQTVTIGQVEENGVRILDIVKHRSSVEISTPPGTLFAFHSSAQGKIALAFGPDRLWQQLVNRAADTSQAKSGIDFRKLKTEIEKIRQCQWAVAPGEALMGINALAAPVFDANNELAGTISIVGSIQHLTANPDKKMISAVSKAAAQVSARLGYREEEQE
ncbi:MAG: IclR family transcriptional regulator [Proteobacteria bacterium]|nr:IclR family transcriptional regulator [Pseudomonadota bacterium]